MRYLVCSDIHLNISRRIEDTTDALYQILKLIEKHKIDRLLILGDVYTSRRPHSKEKTIFQRWVRDVLEVMSPRSDIVIVKGNHDEYPDGTHSYSEFTELGIDRVTVFDNPTIIDRNIFLGHLLLSDAKLGPLDFKNPNCQSASDLIKKNPNCIAYLLGDVHKHQVVKKNPLVVYAGSINRVDFGERNDKKGVLLLETNPKLKCKFVTLQSRSMLQFEYDLENDETYRPEVVESEIKDAIVKLIIRGSTHDIKGQIKEEHIRRDFLGCKEFILQYDVKKEKIARDERVNENITPQQALELYLSRLDLQEEEREAILKIGTDVMERK